MVNQVFQEHFAEILDVWGKTQCFKCYHSKTIAYNEDPHWCSVTGFLKGLEVISVLSLEPKEFAYVGGSEGCFLVTFSCWLKYMCPC